MIRILLACLLLVSAGARAEEEPPDYPPPLSGDLLPAPPAMAAPVTTAPASPPVPPEPAPAAAVPATAPIAPTRATPAPSPLTITVTPLGAAASAQPLPIGAIATLRITVRNLGAQAFSQVRLSAFPYGLKPEPVGGWRLDGGAWVLDAGRIAPKDTIERRLTLQVERASVPVGTRVGLYAVAGTTTALTDVAINAADCAGAYHARLAAIRTGAIQNAKNEADAVRKRDPVWPDKRAFAALGPRTGPLANAERLAASFLAQGGADGELGRDPLRFNFVRWASDLTAYSGQPQNPALCSGAPQVVARYRDLIAPTLKRIESVRNTAASALELARIATSAEPNDDLARVVARALDQAELKADETKSPLERLAQAALDPERKLESWQFLGLSTAETAALLVEAMKRIERYWDAIDGTLGAIGTAAKESCVCAY